MAEVTFGGDYYNQVIEEYGYDPSVFEGFSHDLLGHSKEDLQKIFLCHSGLYDFSAADTGKVAITGFGLSGVPHLGTLSQLNRISMLNQSGVPVEVVLGDLDAYNGKLTPLSDARQLATVYDTFITQSGLLETDSSRVRNQYDSLQTLRTAYLLGRFATDELLDDTEEDLHGFYTAEGKVDTYMTYRRKLSLGLMIGDFIDAGQTHPEVLVMLGIDEHKYVRAAQQVSRDIDPEVSELKPVNIHSLYSPMIKGLRGFPKMSKSFPGSGISLDMTKEEIQSAILAEPDDYETPSDSIICQIACGLPVSSGMSPSEVYAAAENQGAEWKAVKHELIGAIASHAEQWEKAA